MLFRSGLLGVDRGDPRARVRRPTAVAVVVGAVCCRTALELARLAGIVEAHAYRCPLHGATIVAMLVPSIPPRDEHPAPQDFTAAATREAVG